MHDTCQKFCQVDISWWGSLEVIFFHRSVWLAHAENMGLILGLPHFGRQRVWHGDSARTGAVDSVPSTGLCKTGAMYTKMVWRVLRPRKAAVACPKIGAKVALPKANVTRTLESRMATDQNCNILLVHLICDFKEHFGPPGMFPQALPHPRWP